MDAALNLISAGSLRINLPDFKVGQTVRIHQKIKEGEKERIQVFEGLIIRISPGTGVNSTITVRKVVDGVGVERVYPIHSPNIVKIEITKEAKVRRSKLYYMRDRTGKAARLKTTLLEGQVFEPKSATEPEDEADAAEEAEETPEKALEASKDAETPQSGAAEATPETSEPAAEAPTTEAAPEATAEKKVEAPAEEKADAPAEEKAEDPVQPEKADETGEKPEEK